VRAVLAMAVAAAFAFAPLAALSWFAALSQHSAFSISPGQRVVVKPGERTNEPQQTEPGETGLLEVRCDIPSIDGWEELGTDGSQTSQQRFMAREERVYVRRAGSSAIPWMLLGAPPVRVWLPAGDYDILAVYRAPTGEARIDASGRVYPLLSAFASCSLESTRTTICRVPLPHYEWGNPDVRLNVGDEIESSERAPTRDELAALLDSCEKTAAIPTPAGYVLNIAEPGVHHRDGHRECVQDFHDLESSPREWTRGQILTLRNWLPDDAVRAKARLSALADRLEWREFLQGWFCYLAAGISGLVFTRWGAIALLEPWRRRDAWYESIGLFFRLALVAMAGWLLLQIAWSLPIVRELLAWRWLSVLASR
jgi:hypothetical protein